MVHKLPSYLKRPLLLRISNLGKCTRLLGYVLSVVTRKNSPAVIKYAKIFKSKFNICYQTRLLNSQHYSNHIVTQ